MLSFKLLSHPGFTVDLGPHVFRSLGNESLARSLSWGALRTPQGPAQKYRLVRERLLEAGIADHADVVIPRAAGDEDVLRVHTPDYVRKIKAGAFSPAELSLLEVPWSPGLVEGVWLAAGAAIEAGRLARQDGCAIVLGGGFHHAFPDHGEGFCLVHDVAVATGALRAAGDAGRVAVVDLDVHQGNGTAAIFAGDPDTFTVSLHQENNYPAVKPPSSVDVGLPDGTGDEQYLEALEAPLARAIGFQPDLLWYLAGADPYEHDLLGGLALTREGLRERDRRVFAAARSAGVPVAVTLAGGYASSPADTVSIHVGTVLAGAEVHARARDRLSASRH